MHPSFTSNRRAIVITGPVGSGKSTIMATLTDLMEEQGVPNAGIDMDHMRWFYPRQEGDPFGGEVGRKHLAYIASTYRELGIDMLVLADVVEDEAGKAGLQAAIPEYPVTVVRLTVPMSLIEERLRLRESPENLQWYLNRAPELEQKMDAEQVGDIVIEVGERSPREAGEDILRKLNFIRTS